MNRTVLTGMFIAITTLASPVFASDHDLCTLKLQELRDKVTTLPATSESNATQVRQMLADADAANAANDDKKCITLATQAITRVDNMSKEPNP